MTESYSQRLLLYTLLQTHPDWQQAHLANVTGMSESWVKKWRRRLRPYVHAPFDVVYVVLQGQPCMRKTPPAHLSVEEVLPLPGSLPHLQELERPGWDLNSLVSQMDACYTSKDDVFHSIYLWR
ncbi:hypothetical protein [Tengunoibacter tsumagoiensis]|uniref:Uncharacterized protein n=1 Tax=Tengunoibacter tsumagoiensis TaxID=2014871 RepID=A0A402A8J8_9CHLR|nr:hypothetical protein [Tengunoibacter tsumagoiensis]GCE15429.1 hypothetical protein KTT_52880 [Tengunoibacter tsumagoiensis]